MAKLDEWTKMSIYNGLRTGKFSMTEPLKNMLKKFGKLPCKVAE